MFEGGRRNRPDHFSFTGNLSFVQVTPASQADFWSDDPALWISGERMGLLTHGLDHWYRLEDHSPEDLAALVAHDLTKIVLPRLAEVGCADMAVALARSRSPSR